MSADWLTGPESTGAAAGAGVAVINTLKRDITATSFVRFFTGYIFGVFGTEPALGWLGWEMTEPMRMFAASVIGLIAYVVVQIILSDNVRDIIFGFFRTKAGLKEEVKSEP